LREVKRDQPTAIPTRLIITIGGFHGPHYDVRLECGRLQYRTDDSHQMVTPSAENWATFWAAMDRIGVWSWDARYDDVEVLDGIQWSIEISDSSRSVRCLGSNAYPGGQNLKHARPFREFLNVIESLVRRPFGR
jgi:hypothetical protein